MDSIISNSIKQLERTDLNFTRSLYTKIVWDNRMIAITGARGVGKTTLMLQHIKQAYNNNEAIYASLDDFYFTTHTMLDFVDQFVQHSGKAVFLDEVHKYPNWSQELKNCYDRYPDLKIVFTSSSALELQKGSHDLSRRLITYILPGLSFREFLIYQHQIEIPVISIDALFQDPLQHTAQIRSQASILPLFKAYLEYGYYPYFKEDPDHYDHRVRSVIAAVLERDLPAIFPIEKSSVIKLKKLMAILASMTPFKPNIEKLAAQIGTNRNGLLKFLYYLDKASLLKLATIEPFGINYLNKPDKIYLENTNLAYALYRKKCNIGTLREIFVYNQISYNNTVSVHEKADFLINGKYVLEVGGKNKTKKQIRGLENAFIASDEVDNAVFNTIPIWLFGFLY